jgi:SAM-dependent methyltransferase
MKEMDRIIYRGFNADLCDLSDEELDQHFLVSQAEPRIFSGINGDVEFLSMRWLRGAGMEIGAGKYPTPLYGNATALYADCDEELTYGGEKIDVDLSLDDVHYPEKLPRKFDFVIASHVLEHINSFIRGVHNLISSVGPGGIVYIVLPDKQFLKDKTYIPDFSFEHHELEFKNPMLFADVHDKHFLGVNQPELDNSTLHADVSEEYKDQISSGIILHKDRFLHHKHNYNFEAWVSIMFKTKAYLKNSFEIVDIRYGHLRQDCHFILRSY